MNEKITNQIAEMKKQTIGVEVEMNSITREKAARIAAKFFGTGRYENTAGRNGYYTSTRAPRSHALNLEVRLKNGIIKNFYFDVSDQIAKQPQGGVIVVKGIEISVAPSATASDASATFTSIRA